MKLTRSFLATFPEFFPSLGLFPELLQFKPHKPKTQKSHYNAVTEPDIPTVICPAIVT